MKSAIFLEDRKQNDLIRDLQRRVGSLEVRTGVSTGATTGPSTSSAPTTVVTMGGEISGQSSDARVAKIIGKIVTTDAPIGGQYLEYNATEWYPRTGWMKASARAALDSNITISSPGSTLDGLTPVAGQTFLLFGQTDATQNGLYTWFGASEPMVRRYDCDSGGNFVRGFVVTVVEGSYQSQLFVCTAADDIDVGTDNVTFNQVRGVTRVRVNSAGSIYERPRLNFIPGTNTTIGGADDPTDKEIDLTFGSFLVVREVDGSPSVNGTILELPNGTVTDVGGGVVRYTPPSSSNTRAIVSFSTGSLASNAETTGTVTLAKSGQIQKITTNFPARVRLYATAAFRTADALRASTTAATPGTGLFAEVLTTASALSVTMSPLPNYANDDGPVAGTLYWAVENRDSATRTISVDITHLPLEA